MKPQHALLMIMAGWLACAPATARTWTDTTGRTIEADLVRVEADRVILKVKGSEVPLSLSRLSPEDQKFIADWKPGDAAAVPSPVSDADPLTLCGTALKADGKVATVTEPLSAATLKSFAKAPTKPTQLKLAVALPAGFDPAKAQHVMWVSAAINSPEERKRGNTGAIGGYAATATAAGWVVIAADTDLGNPRLEDNERATGSDLAVHLQAVAALAKAWPGSKSWEFACCGHSGGAKASFYRVGDLLAAGLKVTGMYLSGCNQDLTADAREETKCSKAGLHKVNVFISSGKADTIATTAHAESLAKSTKEDFGKIRLEHHDGGHSIDQAEFKKALEWFQSPDPKAKR